MKRVFEISNSDERNAMLNITYDMAKQGKKVRITVEELLAEQKYEDDDDLNIKFPKKVICKLVPENKISAAVEAERARAKKLVDIAYSAIKKLNMCGESEEADSLFDAIKYYEEGR